jgi:preprotein translocase subunit SecY
MAASSQVALRRGGVSDILAAPESSLAREVIAGLTARPKRIPAKYFYDEAGAQLFEAITATPEYYPTRCEVAILHDHAGETARFIPEGSALIELGSGSGKLGLEVLILLALLFVGVVAGVVFITLGQRRIPTQSAKHVRGRRVYGGTRQYLPLLINQSGVMPIIFASSLLLFPNMLFQKFASSYGGFWVNLNEAFTRGTSFIYNILYVALIFFFCYFWTAITFNPKDMANNLKDYGSFIPGYRPGKRTAEYIDYVLSRITCIGAAYLAIVCLLPEILISYAAVPFYFGGTSLLIVVSVTMDTVAQVQGHLLAHQYEGLIKKAKLRGATRR